MLITLYHIHDPMCSWCYAFKPTLDKLRAQLKANVKIVHVVGGLAAHSDEAMPLDQQEMIENIWYEIEKKVGTKFNHDFWRNNNPRRSTYLSCQATMLARYESKEDKMIEAIQNAYYLKAMNPSDASTLIQCADEIGMDKNKFEEDLKSEKIEEDLMNELDLRRSLKVRSFPSLVLKYKRELYPINIQFGDEKTMLEQIENMTENTYF
jgi:putative protein-disulfide isomerase